MPNQTHSIVTNHIWEWMPRAHPPHRRSVLEVNWSVCWLWGDLLEILHLHFLEIFPSSIIVLLTSWCELKLLNYWSPGKISKPSQIQEFVFFLLFGAFYVPTGSLLFGSFYLQVRRNKERHCDTAAAVWTLAGNYSENFTFLNKWKWKWKWILAGNYSENFFNKRSTIVERTWMWRGQSLEFQPSPNSCRRWTGRVYWRPPCVGRRRGRRYPHSLSTPT